MASTDLRLHACALPGVEAASADTAFAFARHTHDQFGVGVIDRGAQRSASGRGRVEAGPGCVITVNPGEVHDGAPLDGAPRAWRMLYIDPAVVAGLAAELAPQQPGDALEFPEPVLHDARAASGFDSAFRALTSAGASEGLAQEQGLWLLLGSLLGGSEPLSGAIPAALRHARQCLDECPQAPLTLTELAELAGLSRYHFLRVFSRATGLTPHAYLLQRRIQRARRLIREGRSLSQAAQDSGFSDQSHMTRVFVRSFGVTPGAYARAMGRRER